MGPRHEGAAARRLGPLARARETGLSGGGASGFRVFAAAGAGIAEAVGGFG